MPTIYNTAAIRELVISALDGDELRVFCFDYFPAVHAQFVDGQTQSGRVQLLLEYVQRCGRFADLLEHLRQANPHMYGRYADRLESGTGVEAQSLDALSLESAPIRPCFVGRERELAFYRQLLAEERFIIITGLAGVGKTTLGARLAQEAAARPDQIFWFTFNRVDKNTSEALFRALAIFLAGHGQPDLKRYLDGELSAQNPLGLRAKLNLFVRGLRAGDYLLCFDDFQLAVGDPDVTELFGRIRELFPGPRPALPARFIIMGRHVPPMMQYLAPAALSGLDEEGVRAYLHTCGLSLPDAQMRHLWERTAGHPKLLELSVARLCRLAHDPAAIATYLANMDQQRDLRSYVIGEIYEALPPHERIAADVLSIFPTPAERAAVEAVLGDALASAGDRAAESPVADTLEALADQQIAAVTADGRIGCHSLVRDYFYDRLAVQARERLHDRAARYYEQQRLYVTASYHHLQRGADGWGADLLAGHAKEIVQAGQAAALLDQAARIRLEALTPEQRAAVCQARGAAYEMRGEHSLAEAAYRRGLDEASEDHTCAELLRQIGHSYLAMGRFEEAIEHCRQSLALSVALGDQPGIADAHHDMGWAAYRMGRLEEARDHFGQCRRIGQTRGNGLLQAKADLGLGALAYTEGRLAEAQACYEESRRGFRRAGDRLREARALNNLGLAAYGSGRAEQALAWCREALAILRAIGSMDGICEGLNNVGDLYLRTGSPAQAIETFAELADLAEGAGNQRMLSRAHAGLSDAHRAAGDLSQALAHAELGLAAAEASGRRRELGISLRALGVTRAALGQHETAAPPLQRAIPILEELHEVDDLQQAQEALRVALSAFRSEEEP